MERYLVAEGEKQMSFHNLFVWSSPKKKSLYLITSEWFFFLFPQLTLFPHSWGHNLGTKRDSTQWVSVSSTGSILGSQLAHACHYKPFPSGAAFEQSLSSLSAALLRLRVNLLFIYSCVPNLQFYLSGAQKYATGLIKNHVKSLFTERTTRSPLSIQVDT